MVAVLAERFADDVAASPRDGRAMFAIIEALIGALLAAFKPRASLIGESLALRQQLATLRRAVSRPHLRPIDRAFWVLLSSVWSRWTDVLAIVQPATVIAWHRRGFAPHAEPAHTAPRPRRRGVRWRILLLGRMWVPENLATPVPENLAT
jgi:hypothetical protein